jgi:FMN phosphatase YigB (HAD superfamily)
MIDWTDIRTVLLDMDGTLLDLHYDNHFWMEYLPKAYAEARGIPEVQARDQLNSQLDAARGSLPWYCLDHWSRAPGHGHSTAQARTAPHDPHAALRPRIPALAALTASLDVLLVTNAHPETLSIKMGEVDITGWFDRVVVSHDLDAPKEQQAFWERLQDLHPFDPPTPADRRHGERARCRPALRHRHLLTLQQPDSSRQRRIDTRFPGIHHFDEIMPSSLP